jgi:hypothetical protein
MTANLHGTRETCSPIEVFFGKILESVLSQLLDKKLQARLHGLF